MGVPCAMNCLANKCSYQNEAGLNLSDGELMDSEVEKDCCPCRDIPDDYLYSF